MEPNMPTIIHSLPLSVSETAVKKYIICTHNSRIRCLLKRYFEGKNNIDKIRFKNCAIFKLTINSTDIITLNLIYGGLINEKKLNKENYFIPSGETNIHKNEVKFSDMESNKKQLLGNVNFNNDIEIFIVRHGEGEHNVGNWFKKHSSFDPTLTLSGTLQASLGANTFLNNKYNTLKFDKLFASKLDRTRETLIRVIDKSMTKNSEIIIVPCSHELAYAPGKDNNCDANQKIKGFFPRFSLENIDNCSKNEKTQKSDKCAQIKILEYLKEESTEQESTKKKTENDIIYKINWNYYNNFYKSKSKCRDTNFIREIIKIIN